MRRRSFLRTLGGAAAAAGLRPVLLSGAGTPAGSSDANLLKKAGSSNVARGSGEAFQQWSWVHGNADRTPDEWLSQFRRLREEGFTGVLVGGGNTEILARAAHENDLEFHRWIWTLNRNGDAWVRENHPGWFTVSRNMESSLEKPPYVGYYRWLCPTKKGVRDYLRDSILKIAQNPVVDGVHLDYVRHCDVILPRGLWSKYDLIQDREYPEFDFCYCDTCREEFASRTGVDPLDLPDPTADEAWRRFRWDSVTELVKILAEAVHGVPFGDAAEDHPERRGPSRSVLREGGIGKPISAAVFPTPTIARRLVRQAWGEWPLDAFFPMLYHEFYEEGLEWIGRGVEEGLAGASGAKLFAGLYLPTLNRDGNRREAVGIARQAGAHGVSFFEMNGLKLNG